MNSKARDSLIGLTAIMGLVLLGWMLMSFGELSGIGQKYQTLVIRTSSARGISPVSPVSLNGVRIGDVTGIRLAADGSGEAVINVRFTQDIQIPADFEIFLDSGFIGSASLDFITSAGPHTEFVEGKGEEYTRKVASLVDSLTAEVSARLYRLDETADKIDALAVTYTDVGQRLADVIDSDDPDADDLSGMMTQLGDSMTEWDSAATSITEQADRLGTRTDESLTKLDSAVVSIDLAAAEARAIAAGINQGQGTLGQLATNADLYRSATPAAHQRRPTPNREVPR